MKHHKVRKKRARTINIKPFLVAVIVIALVYAYSYFSTLQYQYTITNGALTMNHYTVTQNYLTKNAYSRPGIALRKVNGVVVHYTANKNSTAKENRDYFESLATNHKTHASSHFIIDSDGSIIQCIPLTEISYASNSRNVDTIAIECCYEDDSGKFTRATYTSLIALVKALMNQYHLDANDVIRHYDITGKLCPIYFVRNPDEWLAFKKRLDQWSIFGIVYF